MFDEVNEYVAVEPSVVNFQGMFCRYVCMCARLCLCVHMHVCMYTCVCVCTFGSATANAQKEGRIQMFDEINEYVADEPSVVTFQGIWRPVQGGYNGYK